MYFKLNFPHNSSAFTRLKYTLTLNIPYRNYQLLFTILENNFCNKLRNAVGLFYFNLKRTSAQAFINMGI